MAKRAPPEEVERADVDDPAFDDEDLTRDPREAGWDSSGSESMTCDDGESDASLPAGPTVKRKRPAPRKEPNVAGLRVQEASVEKDAANIVSPGRWRLRKKTTAGARGLGGAPETFVAT